MTASLVVTRAHLVEKGDVIDSTRFRREVTSVTRGHNGQIYIASTTPAGAPVVVEHDPDESVTVWREL